MRRVVLREAQRAGIAVEEAVLGVADVAMAEEIFLTNARMGTWPVRELDGRPMQPGPLTRQVQQILAPLLEEPVDA